MSFITRDTLYLICNWLDRGSILSFFETCKRVNSFSKDEQIWKLIFHKTQFDLKLEDINWEKRPKFKKSYRNACYLIETEKRAFLRQVVLTQLEDKSSKPLAIGSKRCIEIFEEFGKSKCSSKFILRSVYCRRKDRAMVIPNIAYDIPQEGQFLVAPNDVYRSLRNSLIKANDGDVVVGTDFTDLHNVKYWYPRDKILISGEGFVPNGIQGFAFPEFSPNHFREISIRTEFNISEEFIDMIADGEIKFDTDPSHLGVYFSFEGQEYIVVQTDNNFSLTDWIDNPYDCEIYYTADNNRPTPLTEEQLRDDEGRIYIWANLC